MLRLVYFPSPGRAEAIRLALSFSGVEWEDHRIDAKRLLEMKESGELPWGMVPVLQTSEGTIAESSAILRYVGRLAGLVPDDPYQAAKADEFIDAMESLSKALDNTFGITDMEDRTRVRREAFSPGGRGAKSLDSLEAKIASSPTGWAAGTQEMSIADLKLFSGLFGLFSGNYDGLEASIISRYPALLRYHDKVSSERRVLDHYSDTSRDDIRWTFLPGAFQGE